MLRDKSNKISREDLETLDQTSLLLKESILSITFQCSENLLKIFIITDKGYAYLYQVWVGASFDEG